MKKTLDFSIIGVEKCGTTALSDYLGRHPEINFCTLKETGYFSGHSRLKFKSEDDFFNLFENRKGLKGEASPSYAFSGIFTRYRKYVIQTQSRNEDYSFSTKSL